MLVVPSMSGLEFAGLTVVAVWLISFAWFGLIMGWDLLCRRLH
jgi:hypothetical protein